MAFGFSPKYTENLPLNELTKEEFLTLAVETAKKMEWEIVFVSENGFIAYTNNGTFKWNAEVEIRIRFSQGYAIIKSESTGNEIMDWGKNKKNTESFISEFRKLKLTVTADELALKLDELRKDTIIGEDDILRLPPPTTEDKILDFFSLFKPTNDYFITPILLNINILLFILMVFSGTDIFEPSSASLLEWGANFRPMTLEGEWWRLFTSCFIHIGIFHLLMNMYALAYIGFLLERYLGKTRFAAAYLLTGVAASITSLWWHDMTISAGASGAIFGMYGFFLALLTTNLIEKKARKSLLASISLFVVYNLLFGLKGGIDNAAHIGGLISGIFMGYAFIPSLKKPEAKTLKNSTIAAVTVLTLSLSFVLYSNTSNDLATYDSEMKKFAENEKKALDIYNAPADLSKDQILTLIKDKGMYYWYENIRLIKKADSLKIPDDLHKKNKILLDYCELRIKSHELMYKAVAEDTQKYREELTLCEDQIRAIITNLTVEQDELLQKSNEQ